MDRIFALASARGKAGVAVIRLSGEGTWSVLAELCGGLPPARRASLRNLTWQGEAIDTALVLLFESGHSFTGEESAEIQVHGSMATVQKLLQILGLFEGLRLAEPGEFTRRALENGCLDLAQVEGLADLIDAETESQRRQALRVLDGHLGRRVEVWRQGLLRAAALIEATIDFADEDVPLDVTPEVLGIILQLAESLRSELESSRQAERIRVGFEVAIVGAPNAGKSTLLNALAKRDVAITSEIAGTTRDIIEVRMDLGGLPVTLLDTAGLRETSDAIEHIGVARAIERAMAADLRVFLLTTPDEKPSLELQDGDIAILGKADIIGEGVSGVTGQGLAELVDLIQQRLSHRVPDSGLLIRERQRNAVGNALGSLVNAERLMISGSGAELVALELRATIRFMELLVGRIGTEALLGEIFASFCIGK
ncbi:tRNA uridine-5-carboxymethylaminomethyl(34) synthesis GTPase MnmE [Fuscibacter oryzae]|uniref:tRNA modification GTPase MnmE n=1 Tax=Fuscibacter oryzae TaxID=2803939 RepID=A0A8J7MSZ0_9RHOB|nr:tRNA uridine-5-carboxymethylaminomethyl(34) synthesis GTPase MnmE [Fuscibacter oryzae]MBL4929062.1 tRNA uridine-5-carboxymethylaminomethyl(34) synthesis GTPase MnmE [Fuscibacter oryzae]